MTGYLAVRSFGFNNESSVNATEAASQVLVGIAREEEDQAGSFWDQVNSNLRRIISPSGLNTRDVSEHVGLMPWRTKSVLVAPGVLVGVEEYEQRYAEIDLEELRQTLSPDLFKAFVSHVGSIPGHPELDISEIATIPQ